MLCRLQTRSGARQFVTAVDAAARGLAYRGDPLLLRLPTLTIELCISVWALVALQLLRFLYLFPPSPLDSVHLCMPNHRVAL